MPKDTGEFIISKSMNLRLPPIFGYTAFLFIPRQVRFSQSLSHIHFQNFYDVVFFFSFSFCISLSKRFLLVFKGVRVSTVFGGYL